jgi:hypothetical protein
VIAGVVVLLVAHLILNIIGIGIGASTVDVAAADNPAAWFFSVGAAIWWAVSGSVVATGALATAIALLLGARQTSPLLLLQ